MKTRLLSVLLVFLLVASVSIPAVSAYETQIITATGECKNSFDGCVADCKLSVWFDYDLQSRPNPHVTECYADYKIIDYPQNTTRVVSEHTAQAHPHIDVGIGSVGFDTPKRTCKLYVECNKDGITSCGSL